MIAGAKLEDFASTGLEFQPTLRAIWTASDRHAFWAAASRAARTPARFELHAAILMPLQNTMPPMNITVTGNQELDAEQLDAYEMGWRWRPREAFTLDAALFVHEYDKLINERQLEPVVTPGFPPQITMPLQFANSSAATGHGVELAIEWRPSERVRVQASGQYLHFDLPSAADAFNGFGADPQYSWSLRVGVDPTASTELDLSVRGVDELSTQFGGASVGSAPGYESVDLRFGWRMTPSLELSLHIDNLLDDEHVEFFDEVAQRDGVAIDRSALLRIDWRM